MNNRLLSLATHGLLGVTMMMFSTSVRHARAFSSLPMIFSRRILPRPGISPIRWMSGVEESAVTDKTEEEQARIKALREERK
jgi:hypothetical protein